VLNAILADGTFIPRAVTRNTSSENALKLKARGAEVVQADLWDVESLKKAITGSEGVFGVSALPLVRLLSCLQTPRLPTFLTLPFTLGTRKAKLNRVKTLSLPPRQSASNSLSSGIAQVAAYSAYFFTYKATTL
jgi:hypothetical protein